MATPASTQPNLTYDGNHNLTYDGVNTLTYDVENRLIQAQNALSGTSQYFYDPLGHRKQKSVGGVTTQFVLVGNDEVADYSGTGAGTPQVLTVRGAEWIAGGLDRRFQRSSCLLSSRRSWQYGSPDAVGHVRRGGNIHLQRVWSAGRWKRAPYSFRGISLRCGDRALLCPCAVLLSATRKISADRPDRNGQRRQESLRVHQQRPDQLDRSVRTRRSGFFSRHRITSCDTAGGTFCNGAGSPSRIAKRRAGLEGAECLAAGEHFIQHRAQ
jgi:hypothetical protein